MSILEDLEDLEMGHAEGENNDDDDDDDGHESSSPSHPSAPPQSIFDLINQRRWAEARGWIDYRPECVYEQNESQHRTPLHLICRMKFVEDGRSSSDGGDDDDDHNGAGTLTRSSDDDDGDTDLQGALSVARLVLECSHSRAEPTICLHPVPDWHPEREYAKALHNSVLTVQDVYGDSALHCLCGNLHGGSAELTTLVLEHTADYDIKLQDARSGGTRKRQRDGKPLPTVYDLLSHQNFHGCTPMHFCVDGGCTPDIVDLMLDACQTYCTSIRVHGKSDVDMLLDVVDPNIPPVERKEHPICIPDEDGDTPAHFACSAGLEPDVLRRLIIQTDRTVVTAAMEAKAVNGRTPIDELITWCIDEHGLEGNVVVPPLEDRMSKDVADALWSRTEVMLEAVVYGCQSDHESSTPLHWAASIQSFPAVILRMACTRFAIHSSTALLLPRDRLGKTLLHHAADPICWNEPDSSVYDLRSGEYLELCRWESGEEKRTPVEYLIQHCPEALQINDKDGNLPLHTALMGKRTRMKDIEAMLEAAPATIAQRDGQGLLPFMIAASRGDHHLEQAFKLLLLNPELVRSKT